MSKQRNSTANFSSIVALDGRSADTDRSQPNATCVHGKRQKQFYMTTFITPALMVTFIVALSLTRLAAQPAQSSEMGFYGEETIEWKAGPAAIPPGAKMAVLEGDPTKEGPFVVRFQSPEGYHIPPHTGTLFLAMGENLDRNQSDS